MRNLLTLIACITLVAACSSKLGHGSSSGGSSPQAVATPIGQSFASSGGAVVITVRSQGDVILSGKDSVPGSAPLTSFAWTQESGDADQVDLIYRTANTVSFTTPSVNAAEKLNLTLTVTDSGGKTSAAKVQVNVQPALDSDTFITAPTTNPTPRTFQIAVVPQSALTLSADAPVCLSLTRTINYQERGSGTASTAAVPVPLPPVQIDSSWVQAAGALSIAEAGSIDAAISSYKNPRGSFSVPFFNDEDLFVRFNQPQAPNRPPALEPPDTASARIARQLIPADVDSASLSVTIAATPGTCATPNPSSTLGVPLIVSILDSTGVAAKSSDAAATPTLTLSADDLHTALAAHSTTYFPETAVTAGNYYAAIDPIGSLPHAQQTLNNWLDANCFNHAAANYGADSHADYTNNFDLGFGRDMYFVTCTQSNLSAGRQIGDSASVVINYPSLEATVQKQNPIIAVAMSHNAYSASGTATNRFTKFFVFAPDDRDGNFYLVHSANFDRRGQRYVPGACVVCHGGTISQATLAGGTNNAAGDLNSAFMPWDEGALLFSDTDPSFSGLLVPKSGYTEADQKASIYALNQHAYATYLTADATQAERFAGPMALIEKWYGGINGAPPSPGTLFSDIKFNRQDFSDKDFPTTPALDANNNNAPIAGSSWDDENTANSDDLYHKVFAHECRACHTQLFKTTANPSGSDRFLSYKSFADRLTPGAVAGLDIPSLLYHQGMMPLARLTADRFWVSYTGGDSPATILARHAESVGAAPAGSLYDATAKQALPSGPVRPAVTLNNNVILAGGSYAADRNDANGNPGQVRIDGSQSFFIDQFQWSLCLQSSSLRNYSGPLCPAALPLVGGTAGAPGFDTSTPGTYALTLNATAPAGAPVQSAYTASIVVKNLIPSLTGCILTPNTPVEDPQHHLIVYAIPLQCANLGDGLNTLTLATDSGGTAGAYSQTVSTTAYQACASNSSVPPPANGSACAANSNQITAVNGISSQWGVIQFEFAATANAAQTLHARLVDADGDTSADYLLTVKVDVTATAGNASYALYPSLAAVQGIYAGASFATHGEAPTDATIPVDAAQSACSASPAPVPLPLSCAYTILPANSAFNLTVSNGSPAPSGSLAPLTFTGVTLGATDSISYTRASNGETTCDVNQQKIPAANRMSAVIAALATDSTAASNLALPSVTCNSTDGDQFRYAITVGGGQPQPANLVVRTDATVSFNQTSSRVFTDLSSNAGGTSCSSCHTGGAAAAKWKYDGVANTTYGSIATCTHDDGSGNSVACVIPGSPEASWLYTNGCSNRDSSIGPNNYDSANHSGQTRTAAECARVYQWIAEGASYN